MKCVSAINVNQIPSSPLQLHGANDGEKGAVDFFNLITGPINKIKNKRIKETLAKATVKEFPSKNFKIATKPKEKIPTMKCCLIVL